MNVINDKHGNHNYLANPVQLFGSGRMRDQTYERNGNGSVNFASGHSRIYDPS